MAVERSLGKIAISEGSALDRVERGVALAKFVQRLLDIVIGNCDCGLVGTQFLIAFEFDFREHFERGFEAHGFAVVQMKVGNTRLRNGVEAQSFGFLAEESRDEGFDYVGFDFLRKALADDRGGNVAATEARDARHLLIFLNQSFCLAADFLGGNFDFNLALCALFCFSGAHNSPFTTGGSVPEPEENRSAEFVP